ncbi:MAG: winged helix-turn-helix domain-containing protein [Saccharospirillum sp.]
MSNETHYSLKLRLHQGDAIALGPGKVDLLEALLETGSISAAARRMKMSYRRAWLLVDTMNQCFTHPLVTTATGGKGGGGAELTDFGKAVLAQYRAMEQTALQSIEADMQALIQHMNAN